MQLVWPVGSLITIGLLITMVSLMYGLTHAHHAISSLCVKACELGLSCGCANILIYVQTIKMFMLW